MADDVKIFLAALATCPAVAAFIIGMASADNVFDDFMESLQAWFVLTIGFMVVVSAAAALVFVWTWAA